MSNPARRKSPEPSGITVAVAFTVAGRVRFPTSEELS
jgi:hypothetical protein